MSFTRIAAAQTPDYRDEMPRALSHALDLVARADTLGVELICFPECFLQGYLTEAPSAHRVAMELTSPEFATVLQQFPRAGPTIVIGMIERDGDNLFNTAVVIAGGCVLGRYRKTHLLAGERVFSPGNENPIFEVAGLRFGINICSDTNFAATARRVADGGASLILCPANNMMPTQTAERFKAAHNAVRGERCRETGLWLMSSDVTGQRDGRVAWGPTAVLDPNGKVRAHLPLDSPGLLTFDLPGED